MTSKIVPVTAVILLVIVVVQLVSSSHTTKHKADKDNFVNSNHSLILGKRVRGDRLLKSTEVKRGRSRFWYVKYDFKYPNSTTGSNRKQPVITFVNVTDLVPAGRGGYPSLVKGGPGQKSVTIHLESRWNLGIDFNITVYGH